MKKTKKNKIEMLRSSFSNGLVDSNSLQTKTGEVLDRLEGGLEMNEETKQIIRDIKSIQSQNEALLEKASRYLSELEKRNLKQI